MMLQPSRRGFLKGASASAATVLLVGITPGGAMAATTAEGGPLNPFVRIAADGKVTAIVKHFEAGQGPATGLTTLIAEELGVQPDAMDYEFAPSNPAVYNNLLFGKVQATGGSSAIANSFMQYRKAGAAARAMLIEAATTEWGVEAAELDIVDGVVIGPGRSAPLGTFVAAAAAIEAPAEPQLKDPSQFKLIGNPGVRRKDTGAKINGTARYAMDVQLDDQVVVAIKRSPRLGGKVASFDASDAADIKGFVDAKALPNAAGIAVYADSTWTAFQARDAVTVDWDFSAAESRSSEQIKSELIAAVNAPSEFLATADIEQASVEDALASAAQIVEGEFYVPMLAHSPMEPLNCTIEPTERGVILHDGCQAPTLPHGALAKVLGLEMDQIQINTLLAGGTFGRRASLDVDYQVEAALAFAMTDRTRPIKLVWSREDDITGGKYRPAYAHKVRAGLDADGRIIAWDHRVAGQSLWKGTFFEEMQVKDGVDKSSVEGIRDTLYNIPSLHVGLTDAEPATTVLWWRSVGHSHTAFVMESMMDMLAAAAGRDPLAFRLDHLDQGNADQKRLAGVLELAAQKAGWDTAAPEGHARGIAAHKSFGTYVAEVAEVSRDADGAVKIEKVTCAVDCGIAVNPDVIKAQMEGGVGFGIGHVMRGEITLEDGEVVQSNFPDYEPLRIGDIGAIETHIIPSAEAPTGVGEPGTPPSAPALANAIAAAGARVTTLPMNANGVTFAT